MTQHKNLFILKKGGKMKLLIPEIKRVSGILKTGARFGLFAVLLVFSSTVWAREYVNDWTPPQTIVSSLPESGWDWDEIMVDMATDLSGHWHMVYSYVYLVEVYPVVESLWTYVKYTNYAGVTEIVAEGFSTSPWKQTVRTPAYSSYEDGHVYGPSITVDRSDTIHVTYICCAYSGDECSIKHTKRAVSTGVKEEPESGPTPSSFALLQNYPNPFNPSTTIKFHLNAQSSHTGSSILTILNIYNIRGQLVRTLLNEQKVPGDYIVTWDGRNQNGRQVSSGVYFYRLQAGNSQESKGMVLLK
jgi:hypothetical protein